MKIVDRRGDRPGEIGTDPEGSDLARRDKDDHPVDSCVKFLSRKRKEGWGGKGGKADFSSGL